MALDRLDIVIIGRSCEVDNCISICVHGESRCWDHSVNRLVATLFNQNERCKFGGVNCEGNASRVNEHDVLMCETCYDVYQRSQRGRGEYFPSAQVHNQGMGHRPQTPYMTGERPEELNLCACNNLDHSDYNEECLLNGNEEEVDEMLDLMQRAYEIDLEAAERDGVMSRAQVQYLNINWEALMETLTPQEEEGDERE